MSESKISGFDPMKHLRETVNEAGERVMRLELPYQKLWFRQTYPGGRMVLNPLRLTDQLAIFEAKVFFNRDDPAPAGSFTANKTALETPGYIRAAQDEALSEALENAGFGFQMCDTTGAAGQEQRGHSTPSVHETAPKDDGQTVQATAQSAPPAPAHETVQREHKEAHQAQPAPRPPQTQTGEQSADAVVPANATQTVQPATKVAEPKQPQAESAAVPEHTPTQAAQQAAAPVQLDQKPGHQPDNQSSAVATLLNFPQADEEPAKGQECADADMSDDDASPTPADAAPGQEETSPQAATAYTEDMSVEDICQLMTLEEAQSVVVPKGPCGGWTMAQVVERRFSSLRFYLTPFCEYSNILKAAATLLIQDAEQKKAG